MVITEADLVLYLSGGGANADPNASLGGAISTTVVDSDALHALFDKVIGDESNAGDIEYRIVYVRNNHATIDAERTKIYLSENYQNQIAIGLKEAVNVAAGAIADEDTAPTGLTSAFVMPQTQAASLMLGTVPHGQWRALYIRRTIIAGTAVKDAAVTSAVVEVDSSE